MAAATELARNVVCVGFDGTTAAEAPLARLRSLGIAATVLFARNVAGPQQLRDLVAALREALADEFPPLIAVDQEGGRVARIRDGVARLPAMMTLGAARDEGLARRAGAQLARDLRGLGINVDFAPVLDLALEPRNTVIGDRSFGEDPHLVGRLGAAVASGLRDGGVVAVGKHFPGHGATEVDSHVGLPVLSVDEKRWRGRELIPFAAAIAAGIPAIMTAHVVLPAFDPARPATLSPPVLRVLRAELGFDGVVFTDCLEMDAIAHGFGTVEAAPLALQAGADAILLSQRLDLVEPCIDAIVRAVENGALPRARLEEAAMRVRRLRAEALTAAPASGDDREIGVEIARRGLTLLRGSLFLPEESAITVVSFEEGEPPSLSSALRARKRKSEIMRVPLEPAGEDVGVLEKILRGMPGRRVAVVMRRAHLRPGQAAAVARILRIVPDAAVVSAREPYDAALFPQAETVACIYDDGEVSIDALADAMTGRVVPAGTLPVRIDPAAIR